MRERDAILALWREVRGRGAGAALATLCEVKGSAYRRPGARMLLCADGRSAGVITGGCMDADLWRCAREVIASGQPAVLSYDTTSPVDIVWGLGLGCRGLVKILVEPATDLEWLGDGNVAATFFEGERLGSVRLEAEAADRPCIVSMDGGRALVEKMAPSAVLWIFGAGPDAAPLARLAGQLGWVVNTIDLRPPRAGASAYLPARSVAPERLGELRIDSHAACVVMSHHFLQDLDALRFLLTTPARYIGMLGPRSRTDALLAELRKEGAPGVPQAGLGRIHAPVGLDIGAETPEEIAVAIVAEIRAVTAGRAGGRLRDRDGGIHAERRGGTGIVILAAGGSSRMGGPKQLLDFQGRSLLHRAAGTALEAGCGPVVVVVGAGADRMREELAGLPVRIVRNEDWSEGLSTSVKAGLAALEGEVEAVIFVPCDQPGVDAGVLNALVAARERSGRGIVVSGYGGAWGAPMLLEASYWPEVRKLTGDRGAQKVAYAHADEVECVPFPHGTFDIDTPADYKAYLQAAGLNPQPPGTLPLQPSLPSS
jgi:xanthine/CO dehydrogenase XdhC/CoxF family maturation factor/CTP:molybdopterin cytidylyltransferase MocA